MSEQKTIEEILTDWAKTAFAQAFPEADPSLLDQEVKVSREDRFGDYQYNAAMAVAKKLGKAPRDIAQAGLAQAASHPAIERTEIAGPGFINIYLSRTWLAEALTTRISDPRIGVPEVGGGATVLIDYSGPNIAKTMHVGHIRSTGIGNALYRGFSFLGYRTIGDNHLGDYGTQFGMLIHGYRHLLNEEALQRDPVAELERVYVESSSRAKEDDEWRDQARRELVKLQQGDAENIKLWQSFVEWSRQSFSKIYDRLGVSFDLERGESFYADLLPGTVTQLKEKGLLVPSQGAQVVDLEEEGLKVPIVVKSDGGFNYTATDLATVRNRIDEFDPSLIVYVTDDRQQLHFNQVFRICEKAGWSKPTMKHIWFGAMVDEKGRPFKTRDGGVPKLNQLLDDAVAKALEEVKKSSPDMAPERQIEVARQVGIGAVKYADLSQNPASQVKYSLEKAMALDGNSAPYLQYAHARICSVLDKYGEMHPSQKLNDFTMELKESQEIKLAVLLLRFPDTVIKAVTLYKMNMIAEYLYEVSQSYSSFYQNLPFLKAEEGVRESRLRICQLVALTLKQGLDLLGIEAPERI